MFSALLMLPLIAMSGRYRNFRMECIKILNFERKINVLYFRKLLVYLLRLYTKKNFNLLQMYLDGHTFQKILFFNSSFSPLTYL
jgi:hypothetical protein